MAIEFRGMAPIGSMARLQQYGIPRPEVRQAAKVSEAYERIVFPLQNRDRSVHEPIGKMKTKSVSWTDQEMALLYDIEPDRLGDSLLESGAFQFLPSLPQIGVYGARR